MRNGDILKRGKGRAAYDVYFTWSEEEMSETEILKARIRYAYRRRGSEDAPAVVTLLMGLGLPRKLGRRGPLVSGLLFPKRAFRLIRQTTVMRVAHI